MVPLNGPTDYRLQRLGRRPDLARAERAGGDRGALRAPSSASPIIRPRTAAKVPSEELSVGGGRTLHVPKSLKGVAVFSFKRLCGEPRGAADYLAIARRFHTVIIVGIPGHGPREPQRGGALRHPDRRALRA